MNLAFQSNQLRVDLYVEQNKGRRLTECWINLYGTLSDPLSRQFLNCLTAQIIEEIK